MARFSLLLAVVYCLNEVLSQNTYTFECVNHGVTMKMDCSSGKDGVMTATFMGKSMDPTKVPNCGMQTEKVMKKGMCPAVTSDASMIGMVGNTYTYGNKYTYVCKEDEDEGGSTYQYTCNCQYQDDSGMWFPACSGMPLRVVTPMNVPNCELPLKFDELMCPEVPSDVNMIAMVGNTYTFECVNHGVTMKMDCSSGKDGVMTATFMGKSMDPTNVPNCGMQTEEAMKKGMCPAVTFDVNMIAMVGNTYTYECVNHGVTMKMDCSSGKDGVMTATFMGKSMDPTNVPNCGMQTEEAMKKGMCPAIRFDVNMIAMVGNAYTFLCNGDQGFIYRFECNCDQLSAELWAPNCMGTPFRGMTSTNAPNCDMQTEIDKYMCPRVPSDVNMLAMVGNTWITTLVFATASGAIGGLGVVVAVARLSPRQPVLQSQLLG